MCPNPLLRWWSWWGGVGTHSHGGLGHTPPNHDFFPLSVFFVNSYYADQWQHSGEYHWALNNTTDNENHKKNVTNGMDGLLYDKPLATRGPSICNFDVPSIFHNSTLHNENWCPSLLHHSSHSQSDHDKGQHTFRSRFSGGRPRSRHSRSMKMVVREVVEQEEERSIRPGWGWRRWASPPSPKTWPGVFLR